MKAGILLAALLVVTLSAAHAENGDDSDGLGLGLGMNSSAVYNAAYAANPKYLFHLGARLHERGEFHQHNSACSDQPAVLRRFRPNK